MKIPVCYISEYGRIIGTSVYDTKTNLFKETEKISNRNLPILDIKSFLISNQNKLGSLVGKVKNNYVVCFGENILHLITRNQLLKINLSNVKFSTDGKVICVDGALEDLSYLFPDTNLKFIENKDFVRASSLGVAKKFIGVYKNRLCVVKFSKFSHNEDLENEILYKRVADVLTIPCCKVIKTRYSGKDCVVSLFEYNPEIDCFQSFKTLKGDIGNILKNVSKKSQIMFDRMLILDFLMSQQDRHMSNLALLNGEIYPLFDNAESLGLGGIGYFSENFRQVVKRMDIRYVEKIMQIDSLKLNEIRNILGFKKFQIFENNLKELNYAIS